MNDDDDEDDCGDVSDDDDDLLGASSVPRPGRFAALRWRGMTIANMDEDLLHEKLKVKSESESPEMGKG